MKMFIFVDVVNYGLISSTSFSSTLMAYPEDQSTFKHHKFRSFRQGLVALWKHFILPNGLFSQAHNEFVAKSFGHNVITHNNLYGVDRTRHIGHSGDGELDYYEAKMLCKTFHNMTSYLNLKRDTDSDEEENTALHD